MFGEIFQKSPKPPLYVIELFDAENNPLATSSGGRRQLLDYLKIAAKAKEIGVPLLQQTLDLISEKAPPHNRIRFPFPEKPKDSV